MFSVPLRWVHAAGSPSAKEPEQVCSTQRRSGVLVGSVIETDVNVQSPPPLGVQEKLGVMNKGLVYALWDYTAQHPDELSFSEGHALAVLRRSDDVETEWWWARFNDREGYVPRNLLGVS